MQRAILPERGVIKIEGPDARTFLQGLVSNDVERADGSVAVYSALLTPQGKYLFDFFIVGDGETLYLDIAKSDVPDLMKRLTMFKLRSKVTLEDTGGEMDVAVVFGDGAETVITSGARQEKRGDGSILYTDPRLAAAGVRAILPGGADPAALGGDIADAEAYDRHRIALGLPAAPTDLIRDKSILLESGFDELNGVDWKKGCYMGQELTARTKYRGLVKKRLVPVAIDGATETGADILADGKIVGDVRSVAGNTGIAMLRLDAIRDGGALSAGDAKLSVSVPDWMQLPEAAE